MENEQPGITLQDIANAVQVIDVASSRGAIRGEELAGVGNLRNRLVRFLEANQQQQAQVNTAEPAAEAVEEQPQTVN